MFKFVHKRHMHKNRPEAKFVIYYSVSDIVLGFLLIVFVAFFTVNYVRIHMSPALEACLEGASSSTIIK